MILTPSTYSRFWIAAVLLALMATFSAPAANACPYQLPRGMVTINGLELSVEIAHTPETRACGLSKRKSLAEDTAMLFVFRDARQRTFWMKDTFIPLSIAFLDEAGKILRIHTMQSDQTGTTYPSVQPARYALEVNQGWFRLHHIKPGDTVQLSLPGILKVQ